jgi:sugar lactone lactonase YvrE
MRKRADRQDPSAETCANLCFGGRKKNRLFMCGSTSIYAVYVEPSAQPCRDRRAPKQ